MYARIQPRAGAGRLARVGGAGWDGARGKGVAARALIRRTRARRGEGGSVEEGVVTHVCIWRQLLDINIIKNAMRGGAAGVGGRLDMYKPRGWRRRGPVSAGEERE